MNRELTARMTPIGTMQVQNVGPTFSSPVPAPCKKEVVVDLPETDGDDNFKIEAKDMRPKPV